ncbi:MAG TPA: hypothetical protein PKZ58_04690, partial [Bacillota bacterium]|nr:hypothetical protein [Bacillota bacterium]
VFSDKINTFMFSAVILTLTYISPYLHHHTNNSCHIRAGVFMSVRLDLPVAALHRMMLLCKEVSYELIFLHALTQYSIKIIDTEAMY